MLTNYEEIVNNFASPTLVIAGPGAGKTYLLADRVMRLLKNKTNKETITVLAFTKDARQRMQDELTDPKGHWKLQFKQLPRILTTHSLAFEILNENPHDLGLLKTNLSVQEDSDVKQLMYRDAALILDFDEEDGRDAHKCKQHGDCRKRSSEKKCQICIKYWEIMRKCNRVDFDDQVLFACEILEKNSEILTKYQSRANHLLLDEYQDFNAAQFRLIELLSRKSRNGLFVVGDDAQSIYGFRGGSPKFILRFRQDFPNAQIGSLPYNRRCPKGIMNTALSFVTRHYPEYKGIKNVEDVQFTNAADVEPYIWQAPSEIAEAKEVANIARSSLEKEKTVLILAPKKAFFPLLVQKLRACHVAYDCDESFLPKGIAVANRFVEWVAYPEDNFRTRVVIEDLINTGIAKVPGAAKTRRCKPETIEMRIAEEKRIAKLWQRVDKQTSLFSVIQEIEDTYPTLEKIRDALTKLIESYNKFKKENAGEFMKQLARASGIWIDPSNILKDLSYLRKLLQPQQLSVDKLARLRTMKKAKGLEADVVIAVGLERDVVPDPRNEIEEEARVFYVCMTRTKASLYLIHAGRRPCDISYGDDNLAQARSQFLDDLGLQSREQWPTRGLSKLSPKSEKRND